MRCVCPPSFTSPLAQDRLADVTYQNKGVRTGQKYQTITESGGKDGERRQIMVCADHVDDFADAVEKARKDLK
jgi:hypothetical protein